MTGHKPFSVFHAILFCTCLGAVIAVTALAGDAAMNASAPAITAAKQSIRQYVAESYAWDADSYDVVVDAEEPGTTIARFLVLHVDDAAPSAPGGGKSLVIRFDMRTMRILGELHFQ